MQKKQLLSKYLFTEISDNKEDDNKKHFQSVLTEMCLFMSLLIQIKTFLSLYLFYFKHKQSNIQNIIIIKKRAKNKTKSKQTGEENY